MQIVFNWLDGVILSYADEHRAAAELRTTWGVFGGRSTTCQLQRGYPFLSREYIGYVGYMGYVGLKMKEKKKERER